MPEEEREQQDALQGNGGPSRFADIFKAGEFCGCGFALAEIFQHGFARGLKEIASVFSTTRPVLSPPAAPSKTEPEGQAQPGCPVNDADQDPI